MYYRFCFFNLFIILTVIHCDGKLLEFNEIKSIANNNDNLHFDEVLKGILKPRIVGTKSHDEVKEFIIRELNELGMHVETDVFLSKPPNFTNLTFTNIIGRLHPNADKYLTLSCHYDSKYYREHNFVGATDSAVPCAIILNTLKTISSTLKNTKERVNLSLMVIFFDGEEAFREWTPTDSLYGSRHLASKWGKKSFIQSDCKKVREIDRIDVLILLDLIGAANPKFYNYYENTYALHRRLNEIESTMKSMKLHSTYNVMFMNRNGNGGIDDDHRPFLRKKVPILHLIATPFPKVWHKPDDNEKNLNFNAIYDFNKVFRAFVYEYLNSIDKKLTERKEC